VKEEQMRVIHRTTLVFALAVTTLAADDIQPLNVKTGLWDITVTNDVKGEPPIPQDRLDKLTPEQRARLERMWKDREAKGAQTKTRKTCVTEAKLKSYEFLDQEPSCTRTVIHSSSRELNFRVQCSSDEGTRVSTYHIQALSPENIKGTIRFENSSGERTLNISNEFTGTWSGPICGTVK
jgi:hypothetical protein